MCRRAVLLAAAFGSLAWAAPLTAQQSEADILRRIETLRSELDVAARELADANERAALEAAAARRAEMTTFEVGPLRVMALDDRAGVAAALFEAVWREDFHGIDGSPSLGSSVFTFDWWGAQPTGMTPVAAADMPGLVVRPLEVSRRWASTPRAMREHVRNVIWSALREDFADGSGMRVWSQDSRYLRPEDVYRSLATMGTGASRSCLVGDLDACAVTLGLAPVERARLTDWFTPRQRRNMVMRAARPWQTDIRSEEADVVACIEREETASCDAVLARIDALDGVVPTRPALRTSLLWYAVQVGGEGAWRRALQDPSASPTEVLERVSGASSEALISGWRAFVLEHRPSVHAGLGRSMATALFWILIFAGFATRSTRWRFA